MDFPARALFSKRLLVVSLLLTGLVLTVACAHQPSLEAVEPPGFFSGLLHGFIILFSLIGSVFMDIRIYAFPNSGLSYDLGFFIGAAVFLGGSGSGASR